MENNFSRLTCSSLLRYWKRGRSSASKTTIRFLTIGFLHLIAIHSVIAAPPATTLMVKINEPLCFLTGGSGDTSTTALKTGDRMPDITIKNMINFKSGSARIYDFKTRLIILDFWSTYCSSCIPSLKKADSLSQVFKGRVTFLPVTEQTSADARNAWKKHGYALPSAVEDKELAALFPHKFLPHIVWILDGKVKAITSSKEVNAGNIKAMLGTGSVALRGKADVMDYNHEKPLFINGNGGKGDELLYYSMIAARTPGLPAGGGSRTLPGNIQRIAYTNSGVLRLYQDAFKEADPLLGFPNRVLFFVPDSIVKMLVHQKDDPYWGEKNSFSYELQLPGQNIKKALRLMQSDLNRFFFSVYGFAGSIEKIEVQALALERRRDSELLKASTGRPVRKVTDTSYTSSNLPLSDLVRQLAIVHSGLKTPIIDLTNYSAPVSMQLNAGLKDLKALNKELKKYGLQLKEGKKVINMLVFRTTDNTILSQNQILKQ